jgi:hypothetical protein
MIKNDLEAMANDPQIQRELRKIEEEFAHAETEDRDHYLQVRSGPHFEAAVPNETTLKNLQDTDAGKNVVRTRNKEELVEKLDL